MHCYKTLRDVIEVKISAWPFQNETHVTPGIRLQPSDSILPFTFQRYFPLLPWFGLKTNKARGLTLQVEGLELRTSMFSHGMFYVALSSTGRTDSIHILTEGEITSNVAYSETLDLVEDLKPHVIIRTRDQRITCTTLITRTPARSLNGYQACYII